MTKTILLKTSCERSARLPQWLKDRRIFCREGFSIVTAMVLSACVPMWTVEHTWSAYPSIFTQQKHVMTMRFCYVWRKVCVFMSMCLKIWFSKIHCLPILHFKNFQWFYRASIILRPKALKWVIVIGGSGFVSFLLLSDSSLSSNPSQIDKISRIGSKIRAPTIQDGPPSRSLPYDRYE